VMTLMLSLLALFAPFVVFFFVFLWILLLFRFRKRELAPS